MPPLKFILSQFNPIHILTLIYLYVFLQVILRFYASNVARLLIIRIYNAEVIYAVIFLLGQLLIYQAITTWRQST
jgi:hypothetical protein